jgi:hypothetical protein
VNPDEAGKYASHARKLESKADKQFKKLDVIPVEQVKTRRDAVMPSASFNLQT